MRACVSVANSTALKRLFLLENDLYLGFDVKICRIKDDFSYTDWEIRVLPDSNISKAVVPTPWNGRLGCFKTKRACPNGHALSVSVIKECVLLFIR